MLRAWARMTAVVTQTDDREHVRKPGRSGFCCCAANRRSDAGPGQAMRASAVRTAREAGKSYL
jgi:hypothetical protein